MMTNGVPLIWKYSLKDHQNSLASKETKEEKSQFFCKDCDAYFTTEHHLLNHLLHHIKQPYVLLDKLRVPSLKITLKSIKNDSFEVVRFPKHTGDVSAEEYFKLNETSSSPTSSSVKEEEEEFESAAETLQHSPEQHVEDNEQDQSSTTLNDASDILDEVQHEEESQEHHTDSHEELNKEEESNNDVDFSLNLPMTTDSPPAITESGTIDESETINEGETVDEIETNETEENVVTETEPPQICEVTDGTTTPDTIPGAEPTPPPEPFEYPKIRIKTTGLLKEPLTITEINDNNQFQPAEIVDVTHQNQLGHDQWSTPSLEDPLRLPDATGKDDGNILSNFLNNSNDQAKDFGLSSSDSEFISIDRLDDRNRNALQLYNPQNPVQNSLESITGLPMQQLAQQVSRLQPGGNNGMHQQNVLINIQQFPQVPTAPAPHGYQPRPMFPPHPGMQPPMYQPYQYQPNMYYPPQPNYPPHHMPPPPPNQMQQQQQQQPQQPQQPPTSQMQPMTSQAQYRPSLAPRPIAPRQYNQQNPRGPPMPRGTAGPRPRGPAYRQRMPMNPNPPGTGRGTRPRLSGPTGPRQPGVNVSGQQHQGTRVVKRTPEQMQMLQAKKRRMDVLVPDKNDDPDCQVIAVQPKNTDGGLPQIQSVQGGTSDPDNSVMHLSDSITLSVRNQPKPVQQPKKSDAKAVANILATRGITVTAAPKKEKQSPQKSSPPPQPVAINLNSSVSIIPTAKNGNDAKKGSVQTVDLTDDSIQEDSRTALKNHIQSSQKNTNVRGSSSSLPYRCDLCPAQYPTPAGLNKHRASYHKTGGPCEIGLPLINLKTPGVLQKLSSLGIYNYIPLPGSEPDSMFALPVVSVNAAVKNNLNGLGASSVLTLGPVRYIPKPTTVQNNGNVKK